MNDTSLFSLSFKHVPTLVILAFAFSLPIFALPVMALGQTYSYTNSSTSSTGGSYNSSSGFTGTSGFTNSSSGSVPVTGSGPVLGYGQGFVSGSSSGTSQSSSSNSNSGCVNLTYNLYFGTNDYYTAGQVSLLQNFLIGQGLYYYSATGYFGPLTYAAVVRFQQSHNISGTGYVGPLTRGAIQSVSCGAPVPPVQSSPVISFLSPNYGPIGTTVTITGSGFTNDNTVMFESGAILHVTSNNGTTLTFSVPDSLNAACFYSTPRCLMPTRMVVPGNYNVSIQNNKGISNSAVFTVTNGGTTISPVVSFLSPNNGTVGTTVIITGSGFTGDNNVKFDVGAITHVSSINGKTLTFNIPSSIGPSCSYNNQNCVVAMYLKQVTPGNYNVSVENANGVSGSQVFTVSGASNWPPNGQSPVISGVSGPTQLSFNQTGTWSVSASDPSNGPLSYRVTWGDEQSYPSAMTSAPSPYSQQTSTFSHSYSQPGTYTIKFTVTNNSGATAQSTITTNVTSSWNNWGWNTY